MICFSMQANYLANHPVHLGNLAFFLILALGIVGYYIFREANCQKDRFRADPAHAKIWGEYGLFLFFFRLAANP